MRPDELAPGHAVARANRSNARNPQPRADGCSGDGDAEPFQLADDALVAPSRVFMAKTDRQHSHIASDRRAPTSALVRPPPRDQPLMPSKQGAWRDEKRGPAVAWEQSTDGGQKSRSTDVIAGRRVR